MAKTISVPSEFNRIRLDGEDFDRYIIPSETFIDILKGKHFHHPFWADFRGEDSQGNKYILLKDNFIVKDIVEIENDIFPHTVIISGGIFESKIVFKSGTYKGVIQFLSGKYNDGILIEGGIFESRFFISGGIFKSVFINGGHFQAFSISGGVFTDTINIREGTFISYFTINDGIFTNLNIVGGTYEGLFSIQGGTFNNINISDTLTNILSLSRVSVLECSVLNNLIIKSKNPIEVLIGVQFHSVARGVNTIINTIKIELKNKSTVKFRYTHINSVLFDNTILNKDTVFNVENCTANQLSFIGLYNYGYVNMSDISIANYQTTVFDINNRQHSIVKENNTIYKLSILNCDLGKMQFINCDFSLIKRFDFVSSKITDMFLAGTTFPEIINTPDFSQQRLGYGQLKKIYENRGDMVVARQYYEREMTALWNQLKIQKTKDNNPERILLWLNYESNRFSTDWVQGVKFTAVVALLFFPYMWSAGYYYWDLSWAGFANTMRYFEFLLPTHKLEMFGEGTNSGFSYIIDFIARIAIGYGIYQTIAAFRKHGRSGA